MEATSSDNVILRDVAISFRPLQNASSRLTLVLCPAMTIERLTTGDFIRRLPNRSCAHQDAGVSAPRAAPRKSSLLWFDRERRDWMRRAQRPPASWLACGLSAD